MSSPTNSFHVGEAHDPVVEVHPLVHLAEFDVAHAVVDPGEQAPLPRRADRGGRDESRQVDTRITGPLDQRVPGVAVCGDRGQDNLPVFVLGDARLLKAAGPVPDRVVVRTFGRANLKGKVDDPVAVRGDSLSQPGASPDRATEDEPLCASLRNVRRLIQAAGLRAAVRHPPHAEGRRIVAGRLLGVPQCEDHGIHADREAVLRLPGRAGSMRH
jgi:hypothetical protein